MLETWVTDLSWQRQHSVKSLGCGATVGMRGLDAGDAWGGCWDAWVGCQQSSELVLFSSDLGLAFFFLLDFLSPTQTMGNDSLC